MSALNTPVRKFICQRNTLKYQQSKTAHWMLCNRIIFEFKAAGWNIWSKIQYFCKINPYTAINIYINFKNSRPSKTSHYYLLLPAFSLSHMPHQGHTSIFSHTQTTNTFSSPPNFSLPTFLKCSKFSILARVFDVFPPSVQLWRQKIQCMQNISALDSSLHFWPKFKASLLLNKTNAFQRNDNKTDSIHDGKDWKEVETNLTLLIFDWTQHLNTTHPVSLRNKVIHRFQSHLEREPGLHFFPKITISLTAEVVEEVEFIWTPHRIGCLNFPSVVLTRHLRDDYAKVKFRFLTRNW